MLPLILFFSLLAIGGVLFLAFQLSRSAWYQVQDQFRILGEAIDLDLTISPAALGGRMPGVPSLYGRIDGREASVQCIGHGSKESRKSETAFLIAPANSAPGKIVVARDTLPNRIEFKADRHFTAISLPKGTAPAGWRAYATDPAAASDWLTQNGSAFSALSSNLRGQYLFTSDRYGYKETGLMTRPDVRQRFEEAIATVLQIGTVREPSAIPTGDRKPS